MENTVDQEFLDFLANSFATNQEEWKPWFNFIGKHYYWLFLKNNAFLLQIKISYLKADLMTLSEVQKYKNNIVFNLWTLFNAINYHDEDKTIEIETSVLDSFNQVDSQLSSDLIKTAKQDLMSDFLQFNNNDKNKISDFEDLINEFQVLINFYKSFEMRKAFFKEIIIKNQINNLVWASINLTQENINYIRIN